MAETVMSLAVELGLDAKNLTSGLAGAEGSVGSSMRSMGGHLIKFGAVAATACIGAVAALGALVLKTAEAADRLAEMSARTGIGVEQLQVMSYVGQQAGVSLDTMTGSLGFLVRNMSAASNGTGSAGKAFTTLGVAVENTDGSLRDQNAVMGDTLTALRAITNPTERNALAMQIFGRSAMDLAPLLALSAEELAALEQQARDSGAVMSEETVLAAAQLQDQIDGLKMSLQGVVGTLMGAFMPGMQLLVTAAQGYIGQLNEIVASAGGDPAALGAGIGDLVGTIIGDIAAALPEIFSLGLGIVNSLLMGIIAALPTIVSGAMSLILGLQQAIFTALPMLLTAGFKMIITIVQGIAQALPAVIPQMVQVLISMVQILIENIPLLITAGLQLLQGLVEGIMTALPILIAAMPTIIITLITALLEAIPMILTTGIMMIEGIIQGLVEAIPLLIEMIPTILVAVVEALITNLPLIITAGITIITTLITGIVNAIKALVPALLSAGRDVIIGLWNGLTAAWPILWNGLMDLIKGIINAIKGALGIHSPSTIFAGIGQEMALGLNAGFNENVQTDFSVSAQGTIAGQQPASVTQAAQTAAEDARMRMFARMIVDEMRKAMA